MSVLYLLQSEYQGQFVALPEQFGITLNKDYDFASIMHFNGRVSSLINYASKAMAAV